LRLRNDCAFVFLYLERVMRFWRTTAKLRYSRDIDPHLPA